MKGNILVVSVNAWNDEGILSTMQNLFQDYDSDRVFSLYFRSELPNTVRCGHSFQIRELLLYKKLFNRSLIVGRRVPSQNMSMTKEVSKENNYKRLYRSFYSSFFLLLRETVWSLGGWKEKQLKEYVEECNPSVIFVTVSSYIYTNRVVSYLKSIAPNAKLVLFFVDDNYTYKATSKFPLNLFHRFLLRRILRSNVKKASDLFAISPKMKLEYEDFFKRKFSIMTKSVQVRDSFEKIGYSNKSTIQILYVGNLLYGRLDTLMNFSAVLEDINKVSSVKFHLLVYTQTIVPEKNKILLSSRPSTTINKAVPYSQVSKIQRESDILLFMESFIKSKSRVARLSFSTKITDYLGSGKAIIAIGPSNIAPIEYFCNNKAAIVINNKEQIYSRLLEISKDLDKLNYYRENALDCCLKYHNKANNNRQLNSIVEI